MGLGDVEQKRRLRVQLVGDRAVPVKEGHDGQIVAGFQRRFHPGLQDRRQPLGGLERPGIVRTAAAQRRFLVHHQRTAHVVGLFVIPAEMEEGFGAGRVLGMLNGDRLERGAKRRVGLVGDGRLMHHGRDGQFDRIVSGRFDAVRAQGREAHPRDRLLRRVAIEGRKQRIKEFGERRMRTGRQAVARVQEGRRRELVARIEIVELHHDVPRGGVVMQRRERDGEPLHGERVEPEEFRPPAVGHVVKGLRLRRAALAIERMGQPDRRALRQRVMIGAFPERDEGMLRVVPLAHGHEGGAQAQEGTITVIGQVQRFGHRLFIGGLRFVQQPLLQIQVRDPPGGAARVLRLRMSSQQRFVGVNGVGAPLTGAVAAERQFDEKGLRRREERAVGILFDDGFEGAACVRPHSFGVGRVAFLPREAVDALRLALAARALIGQRRTGRFGRFSLLRGRAAVRRVRLGRFLCRRARRWLSRRQRRNGEPAEDQQRISYGTAIHSPCRSAKTMPPCRERTILLKAGKISPGGNRSPLRRQNARQGIRPAVKPLTWAGINSAGPRRGISDRRPSA
ncbi:hypothetical protein NITMOv2_1909 [Nitrospira moscoviensis]|uniref:Uncharacterized protein n=1 Tax=Nitrospira moscoviensis TaxID=42253 RepID=A0A0K2GBK1_NITMO|nr:hypothetical protein NITMOv2_1909 [Nitrospira moscoviensis]